MFSPTARMITAPLNTCCQYAEIPSRIRPLRISPSSVVPRTVPRMDPSPPNRLAPPMTTAPIATSS